MPYMDLQMPPLVAILYEDGRAAACLQWLLAEEFRQQGCQLVGYIARDAEHVQRHRCDMRLHMLAGGPDISLAESRGSGARGCHLDVSQLLHAVALTETALDSRPDLLLINKFGKTEAEGGGARGLIGKALDRGIPVVIAVPWMNVEAWRGFAGGIGVEWALDAGKDHADLLPKFGISGDSLPDATNNYLPA